MTMVLYIAVMAGITYLIRMIPMVFFRKKIYYRRWGVGVLFFNFGFASRLFNGDGIRGF
jgi:branched-subunit amino acid transport protein